MNQEKKVSVIVPVYNTEKYLDRCLESLTGQTLKDLEIIVVDDGSAGLCAGRCDQWAKRDERIRVIHKKNEGLGYARNTGIEAASGEYIAFVDSDDYVRADMYEKLYEKAREKHSQIVVGGYVKKYDNGQEERFMNEGIPEDIQGEDIGKILLANMLGAPPSFSSDDYIGMSVWKNLYSREVLLKHGIRFPSEREYISEDIIFHIRYLHQISRGSVLHDSFYFYCQNAGSLSTSYRADRFDKVLILYDYEKKLLEEYGLMEWGKLQFQRTFIANVRTCIMLEAARGKRDKTVKKALGQIRRYCREESVQSVLREFPWKELPIKQRVFSFFMTVGFKRVLYLLACMQNRYNEGRRK